MMDGMEVGSTRIATGRVGTFFAAADEPVSDVLGQEGFDKSLLCNFLFGKRVILHEAYFFNSSLLCQHVANAAGGQSLFQVSARAGLMSPAFRFSDVQTLDEALRRMREEVYTPGDLPRELTKEHRAIMRAASKALEGNPAIYPTAGVSTGEVYQHAMEEYFGRAEPPPGVSEKEWEAILEWGRLIPEARERTAARHQAGLQRSEMVRAICRVLGVSKDIAYLPLQVLRPLCGFPERYQALRSFWAVMNQTHWMSYARSFALSSNIPGYEVKVADLPPEGSEPEEQVTFSHEVDLPSVRALLRVPPAALLAVRQGAGHDYHQLLQEKSPNPDDIRTALQTYGQGLCNLVGDSGPALIRFAPEVTRALTSLAALGTFAQGLAKLAPGQSGEPLDKWVTVGLGGLVAVGWAVGKSAKVVSRSRPHTFEFVLD
jgi:hypothetical protein